MGIPSSAKNYLLKKLERREVQKIKVRYFTCHL